LIDQNLWSNHGYLLLLLTLLLGFMDSDAALSVRWLQDGRPEREIPSWPVILIGIQLSIVYFYTAIAKINPVFLGGDIIQGSVHLPPSLRRPGVVVAMAVATVTIELFLVFGLWLRRLRPWAFLLGFCLHGSITVLMGPALWIFSLMTLSAYAVFLDARPRSRLVVWDDRCGFCGSWIRLFQFLDWLNVHRFEGSSRAEALAEAGVTSEGASEEIKLRDGDRVYGGFDAIRLMLEATPAGFLWARALALPPIRWAGVKAYRAVARRRHCTLAPAAPV
jgi:predicted DCC family thiol-disulfide oxidoreductase YuxK